jgi:hypothetical protein
MFRGGVFVQVKGGTNLTGLRRIMNAFLGVSSSISRRYTFRGHYAGMFGVKNRCTIPMKIPNLTLMYQSIHCCDEFLTVSLHHAQAFGRRMPVILVMYHNPSSISSSWSPSPTFAVARVLSPSWESLLSILSFFVHENTLGI